MELTPPPTQRDPLLQVVDVTLPGNARATVGDGLRHVLKRSGYRLCQTGHAPTGLYGLSLPAAHLKLGPMTLRNALLTLAGLACELNADDRVRQVCFVGVSTAPVGPETDLPVAEPAQTLPLSEKGTRKEDISIFLLACAVPLSS